MLNEEIKRAANVASQLFGREPTKDDWVRDINLRLQILFTQPSQKELESLLTERFKYRAAYARPAIEAICNDVEGRPEGYLSEIGKVRAIVEQCVSLDFTSGSPASQAVLGHIHQEAVEIEKQKTALAEEWNDARVKLEIYLETISNVVKATRSLYKEPFSERGAIVRESRGLLANILSSGGDVPAIIYLCAGWLSLQNPSGLEEAVGTFKLGVQSSTPCLSTHLMCRILSDLNEREGNVPKAIEWSKTALEHLQNSEAYLDLFLLSAEIHEPGNSKDVLWEALLAQPFALISLFSDDRSATLATDILDIVVRVQNRLRRDGRKSIGIWLSAVQEVQEAQRLSGANLHISHELMESHKIISERLAEADLITAGFLTHYSEDAAEEIRMLARQSLAREFDKRRQALSDARKMIDSIAIARDRRMEMVKREYDRLVAEARQLLTDSARKSKSLESQSIYWFVSGCGLFILFAATKFVLSSGKSNFELSSPISILLLIVAAIPIAMATTVQVGFGIRRAALDILVRDKIAAAKKQLNQAELEADDAHRKQLVDGRKALLEAESKLKRVESAYKFMKMSVIEMPAVPTRLRAAA